MKVKVIKANLLSYWYADKIGEVFDVVDYSNINQPTFAYHVKDCKEGKLFNKDDVEIINEENQMFDMKKEKWFIRTPDEATYNDVYAWLQEQGFHFGWTGYAHEGWEEGMQVIGSWPYDCENEDRLRIGNVKSSNYFSDLRHKEIKLTFKTIVDSVEYPETKSAEQIQLEVLQEKIAELNAEATKLSKIISGDK